MLRTLTLALCLGTMATPVFAESFLERMAQQAAEKMAQKAADSVMNGGGSSSDGGAKNRETSDDPQAGQVLKPKPRATTTAAPPAPAPTAAPGVKAKKAPPPGVYPGTIAVSADIKAKKDAFDEFGKVRCSDCEGGYSYDSWTQIFFNGELAGEYNGWAKKLGNLKVGERLTWKGKASKGTLTVVSDSPVEGFRCKQLTYRLDKPNASAERPGLVCWGKLNEYSSNDSWVIVY
ncbi:MULTISPECIES: hypothetical protein [Asticcacaulis]|uniref:hypothetical protein n=1 Tax=Asticcacaulis TaxID=76890 RepID=UPI001AE3A536|nr:MULTISPECIES: hypothetical protein [Asticcacaulis]MBP2161510.1 hypothetical protein [Asticcacaulis solisilvae]MDR6802555.1 hypothetical protein [Asticcacaulis sp. BE141]